jgi:hypothetical protein
VKQVESLAEELKQKTVEVNRERKNDQVSSFLLDWSYCMPRGLGKRYSYQPSTFLGSGEGATLASMKCTGL